MPLLFDKQVRVQSLVLNEPVVRLLQSANGKWNFSTLGQKQQKKSGDASSSETRVVNFYNVNDELMLVDLPGYGYAKVSKEEKKTWGNLTETYLMGRKSLKAILLLVDIRHEPTDDDCIMMNYIRESGRRTAVIATKADKLNRPEYKKQIDMIRTVLYLDAETEVIPFSSLKRIGIADVWSATENLLK
jgi:GTP-binding protein